MHVPTLQKFMDSMYGCEYVGYTTYTSIRTDMYDVVHVHVTLVAHACTQ